MTNKSGETKFNNKQIINPQLLQKIATYFSLLDNPDSGLTQERAEVNAGKYFAENIAGKYSDYEISTAIFMSR